MPPFFREAGNMKTVQKYGDSCVCPTTQGINSESKVIENYETMTLFTKPAS